MPLADRIRTRINLRTIQGSPIGVFQEWGKLPEEVLVEGSRNGQIGFGFENPKCASAWDLRLVGKLRWLAKPVGRKGGKDGQDTCLLHFHLHLRGDSPTLPGWLLRFVALCLVDSEVRPLTSGNQTGGC